MFVSIVRANPDIPFVAVLKDAMPDPVAPNLRCYVRLSQPDLAQVMGACRVGLCTSRSETQHLAGIEMGACGLPLVVPPVGTYWERVDWPGFTVMADEVSTYTNAIRAALKASDRNAIDIRNYWMKSFHPEVVRLLWTALIKRVENGGAVTP
jgi:glycosyltransferase involved in cell wall biosynthesis